MKKLKQFFNIMLVALIFAGGGTLLSRLITNAIYINDTTSYVKVNELYDDSLNAMDPDNVSTLIKYITGNVDLDYTNAEAMLDALATNITTSADIRSKSVTVNGVTKSSTQDVIVTFGGLDWQVVYLSKDNSGNNILTLWLSTNYQKAWENRAADEGEFYGFIDGALYSDWSADWKTLQSSDKYLSRIYGTSYVSAVTLNNGGEYAISSTELVNASQSENSVFARFTMEDVEGSLTEFIVTPNNISWQLLQSAVVEIKRSYFLPNDSINDPTGILSGSYFPIFNYHSKYGYANWANDYLWLPSVTETGLDLSFLGMWETSLEQRKNLSSGSTIDTGVGYSNTLQADFVSKFCILRSGATEDANYEDVVYMMRNDGFFSWTDTYFSYAVRPALHLNLNAVIESATPKIFEISLDNNGGNGIEKIWLKYNDGYYDNSTATGTPITSLSSLPVREGFTFKGYHTAGGVMVIDESGEIVVNSSIFTDAITLYAQWEANIPAYYDEEGGYWYIENGRMPQTRVTDSEIISYLDENWDNLAEGNAYLVLTHLGSRYSKLYDGVEYFQYNENYYYVEPIRWRLKSSTNQQLGYATGEDTLVILDTIIYVGRIVNEDDEDFYVGAGEGYYDTATAFFSWRNQIDIDLFAYETKSMPTFGTTSLYGEPQDFTNNMFVASYEEIVEVMNPNEIKFSDIVLDYFKNEGKVPLYYTRNLGTNYNNYICLNENGDKIQQKPNIHLGENIIYNRIGIQFSAKIKEYACVER